MILMEYLYYFTNQPLYAVGDNVVSRDGNSSFSSGSGQHHVYYSYNEELDGEYGYINVNHIQGERNYGDQLSVTVTSEDFVFNLDENNSSITHLSANKNLEQYDDLGRIEYRENIWLDFGTPYFSNSYQTTAYEYVSTSRLLSTSVHERIDTWHNGDILTTMIYTYDYTGKDVDEIWFGELDYTTRWGLETRRSNYEWQEGEQVTYKYTKETRNNQGNSNSSSDVRVQTDDQGIITNAESITDISSYGNNGSYAYSNSSKNSSDYDGDGIVNNVNEYTSMSKNDRYSTTYLTKNDYDGDGYADTINMTRSSDSSMGRMTTEYRYDTTQFSRPILEIIRSLDTDMDGIADLIDEKAVFRTLTARHTAMGGHVATLDDVLA